MKSNLISTKDRELWDIEVFNNLIDEIDELNCYRCLIKSISIAYNYDKKKKYCNYFKMK